MDDLPCWVLWQRDGGWHGIGLITTLLYHSDLSFCWRLSLYRINVYSNALWQTRWYSVSFRLRGSLSTVLSLPPYFCLPHRERVVITRLYIRTCLLTYLNWFTRSTLLNAHLVAFSGALLLSALSWSSLVSACVDIALPRSFRSVLMYCYIQTFHQNPKYPSSVALSFFINIAPAC